MEKGEWTKAEKEQKLQSHHEAEAPERVKILEQFKTDFEALNDLFSANDPPMFPVRYHIVLW